MVPRMGMHWGRLKNSHARLSRRRMLRHALRAAQHEGVSGLILSEAEGPLRTDWAKDRAKD